MIIPPVVTSQGVGIEGDSLSYRIIGVEGLKDLEKMKPKMYSFPCGLHSEVAKKIISWTPLANIIVDTLSLGLIGRRLRISWASGVREEQKAFQR